MIPNTKTRIFLSRKKRNYEGPDVVITLGEDGVNMPLLYDTNLINFNVIVFLKELFFHLSFPFCFFFSNPCHHFFVFNLLVSICYTILYCTIDTIDTIIAND